MDKKEFLEKVWKEVFGNGNTRVDFDTNCFADTTVDGKTITCDSISCEQGRVKLHDVTESEDMGWFLISENTDIDEDSLDNILGAVDFVMGE